MDEGEPSKTHFTSLTGRSDPLSGWNCIELNGEVDANKQDLLAQFNSIV